MARVNRRALIALAAGGALALAAGGTVVLRSSGSRGTAALQQQVGGTASPSATPSEAPSASPSEPAPTASPTAVPTTVAPSPLGATPTPRPTSSRQSGFPPYRARALPTGCLSFGNACTYSDVDERYAVTGGVEDLRCRLDGATGIRVTWRSVNLAGHDNMPPVGEFVVRLWRYPADEYDGSPSLQGAHRLRQVRTGRSTFGLTVRNLIRGERYACFVQELNLAGLSSAMGVHTLRIPGGSPSATPTPPATPSPSATPTGEPSETPAP